MSELPKYITMKEYADMRRTSVDTLYVQYVKNITKPPLAKRYKVGSRTLIKLDEAISSIEAGKID